jgi:hypothetical protein
VTIGVIGPPDKIDIGSVVTYDCLLDFLILYESLLETWTSYPFVLHALAAGDEVAERLVELALEHVEIHRSSGEERQLEVVEHSRFERCIVTDAGNVFLAEIPELWFLLADHDLVVAGAPNEDRPIESSLWSFRRNRRGIEWPPGEGVSALALPPSYALDAGLEGLSLERDQLGFIEARAGRVKVLHLGGLGGQAAGSLADRIDVLVDRFPRIAPLMSFYVTLARRAAERLGVAVVPNPELYLRDRLLEAGILPARNQLPELLNRRGLGGTGVEVGVKRGIFSESILRGWRGRTLISVDPWLEAPEDEYVDIANVTQAEHDRFYEETTERLERFGKRSVIWRMTSTEAAARIEPGTLDFVYLDARHDYGSVTEDLEQWFDKIRPGGVFAGHDYFDGLVPAGLFGVKSAVDEFFAARGLRVKPTYAHMRGGHPASWLVEIPAAR